MVRSALTIALCGALLFGCGQSAKPEAEVFATVNGRPLTKAQADAFVAFARTRLAA